VITPNPNFQTPGCAIADDRSNRRQKIAHTVPNLNPAHCRDRDYCGIALDRAGFGHGSVRDERVACRSPLVFFGIVLAAWVMASGSHAHIARVFEGRVLYSVIAASAIGAVTPVCGVTVLPLMAGLLAAGVPLAPVMAFWLSSPITDPAMLATTAATLGFDFAVGKTIAAFGLGMWGGAVTATLAGKAWAVAPLRNNRIVGSLSGCGCNAPLAFQANIWRSRERRAIFWQSALATTRLVLICLIPAFAAEYALNAVLQPEALTAYVGKDIWWAIPFAVFVGAPAYLDGYAALPLTRALMDHGMSPGAALEPRFVSDAFTDGRRFRILTVVDDCTRENLALIADTSVSGLQVLSDELEPVSVYPGMREPMRTRVDATRRERRLGSS